MNKNQNNNKLKNQNESSYIDILPINNLDTKINNDNIIGQNTILNSMGLQKLTIKEQIKLLIKKMNNICANLVKNELIKASNSKNSEKEYKIILNRYLRQYGTPFRLKKRDLCLDRYYDSNKVIDHYGVFLDNKGLIFHFLPNGVIFGEKEYNKEICSYDWTTIPISEKQIGENHFQLHIINKTKFKNKIIEKEKYISKNVLFTLLNEDDIKYFCERWNNSFEYCLTTNSSISFASTLIYYLS